MKKYTVLLEDHSTVCITIDTPILPGDIYHGDIKDENGNYTIAKSEKIIEILEEEQLD